MNQPRTEQMNPRVTAEVGVSDMLGRLHPSLLRRLQKVLNTAAVAVVPLKHTRDIWVRDFMPIQRDDGVLVSYTYRPDYLPKRYRNLITDWKTVRPLPKANVVDCGLVLDGGNVVLRGRSAIVTKKVFTENSQLSSIEIERRLRDSFQLDRLIFIPNERGDVWGHADGMVAWAAQNQVLVNDYRKIDPGLYRELKNLFEQHKLDMTLIPYVPDVKERPLPSAEGTYVNLLELPRLVLVPQYAIDADDEVCRVIQRSFPAKTVVPLNASSLAREGGSIHCVTVEFEADSKLMRPRE